MTHLTNALYCDASIVESVVTYQHVFILFVLFQLYEKHYQPHQEGVYQEQDSFVVDKYSGGATDFNVFSLSSSSENYLKGMSLQDRRGNTYSDIMETLQSYHIFSIFNVPFKSVS
jgi:hypothetical protein